MSAEVSSVKKDSGARPPLDPPRRWRFGTFHLLLLVIMFAVLFWFYRVGGPVLVLAVLFLCAVVFAGTSVLMVRRWSTYADTLLDVLAIAAERGMPLAPAVEAFADQCRGGYRRKLVALAGLLADGAPLPGALDHVRNTLPPDAVLLVRIGWATGTLPGALREAASLRAGARPAWIAVAARMSYLLFVVLFMQVIIGFLAFFILPKFEVIYRDFGVTLPTATLLTLRASRYASDRILLVALLVAVELGWFFCLVLIAFGRSEVAIPLFDRLLLRRHAALVLRALAWSVEAGKPMTWGAEALARCYPTAWVRERMRRVSVDVAHGEAWLTALRAHGLIRAADAAVLDAAQRVGNLPWALRQAAETGERRLAYRLQLFAQALYPLIVFLLGALVGMLAAAYFAPLVTLIGSLAG